MSYARAAMNTLIKNVDVVTLDETGTIQRGVDLAIADGKILSVGSTPAEFQPAQIIDGYNKAALPGFFNAHSHVSMTLLRGWAEDLPLDRWFNERIWVAESALTSDDVYWGAALAACELLRGGCIAFNDHYFYMDRVAEVVEQAGMKASLAWCQFGLGADKEVGTDLAGTLAFAQRWQGAAGGRITTRLGPHSPYICPPEFLREISALAQKHALPLHIHLAESQEQVENSLRAHGLTPTALLASCGVFDVPCVAAHSLFLTDEDVQILAQKDVTVAHCPITYLKLAMGVSDLPRLQRAGVRVALGTDGPGSGSDLDMKAAARFTTLLQKHHTQNAEALAGDLPLRMATAHGAYALGFKNSGALVPGRAADLILFDLDQPHLHPRHNLIANLVHCARSSDVSHVFVDGRLLVENGELRTLDQEKILAEAEQHAQRMVHQNLHILRKYQG